MGMRQAAPRSTQQIRFCSVRKGLFWKCAELAERDGILPELLMVCTDSVWRHRLRGDLSFPMAVLFRLAPRQP